MRQCHGLGWALVGDAGYFKDRLTSHGISDAFRDAELLAAAMVEGTEAALARYRAERDAPSTDLFRVADEIASFAWDLDAIQRHLERLSAAMKTELASLATRAPGAAAVRLSSYAA
jgi:flavin-dependent dehydrogenase